jgi:glycerol-3-phosphate O-acyltransferase / dihydroxyacetone phosphate acyltransferase
MFYALSLPLTGFFVLDYWNNLVSTNGNWKLFLYIWKKESLIQGLIQERESILRELDSLKNEYVLHLGKEIQKNK